MDALFADHDALDERRLVDRVAHDGLDLNVVGVDPLVVCDRLDRPNDEVREVVFRVLGALAGHRGRGDALESLGIVGRDLDGALFEDVLCLLGGLAVPLGQDRRVDVLIEQVLGLREQLAGDHDRRRGAVAHLVFLGLSDLDDHIRRRVLDVHLVEDRHAIVRDDDAPARVDEHLVHAFRSECRPNRFGHGLARRDVHRLCVLTRGAL